MTVDQQEKVDALVDDQGAFERLTLYATHKRIDHSKVDIRTLLSALTSEREENERLREALKPFAVLPNSKYDDGESFGAYFSVGAVRRAHAALSPDTGSREG